MFINFLGMHIPDVNEKPSSHMQHTVILNNPFTESTSREQLLAYAFKESRILWLLALIGIEMDVGSTGFAAPPLPWRTFATV